MENRQIFFPTLSEHVFFCFPESVGIYLKDPAHIVRRDATEREDFSIHVVTGGKGYVELEGKVYTLQKGDGFLYFPHESQCYYSSQEEPWDVRWMHFHGHKVKEFLVERGFHRTPLWTLKQWNHLELAHQELLEEAEQHKLLHGAKLSALTYHVLIEFVCQAMPLTPNKGTDGIDRILALLPQMQELAVKPFVLEDWAGQTGISTYHFCKLFRKATTMTPMTFITLCRLQLAKQWLLEKEDWPIKRISLEAGYPTVSYFNKRFWEQERMTPMEYRRMHSRKE